MRAASIFGPAALSRRRIVPREIRLAPPPSLRASLPAILVLCALLPACSLPRGAPAEREILNVSEKERDFAVYPVTKTSLPALASWPRTGPVERENWPGRAPGGPGRVIAPGDRLDVVIWDNEENSLLTSPAQRSVNLSGAEVTPEGTIFMPYLENVHVAGLSPEGARRAIQTQMATLMPSSQVQLNMAPGRGNSVDLVAGVARPGTYPLIDRNMSILSLVSQGGGVGPGMRNPQVRLMRGANRYTISLERLYSNPALDTTLKGGDKIFVEEDKRYFLSLGAAGTQNMVHFPQETVTALDAISLVSGVDANRGNPRGILVLREYPNTALRAGGRGGPEKERTVFTIDLTSADGLFSARKFTLNPDDVVLVTESPVNAVRTILQLIGLGTGSLRQVDLVLQN